MRKNGRSSSLEDQNIKNDRSRVNDNITGLTQMVTDRVDSGFRPYLTTFMFKNLRGSTSIKLDRMKDEIQRVYAILVTWILRYPKTAPLDALPVLVGAPDLPVPKHSKKQPISDFEINQGFHFHGVLLIPPVSRLKEPLPDHFTKHRGLYCPADRDIDRIDIKPIETRLEFVTDYALKGLRNWSAGLTYEDVLILPRGKSELG